jgi:hypothetical protein
MRITIFSPKAVGSVASRISTSPPCGIDRAHGLDAAVEAALTTSMRLSRVIKATIAHHRSAPGRRCTPSMRKRITPIAPRLEVDVAGAPTEGAPPCQSTT